MDNVRVLCSGLTGETGRALMERTHAKLVPGIEITGGISRKDHHGVVMTARESDGTISVADYTGVWWYTYDRLDSVLEEHPEGDDYDVLVAFDHAEVFDKVLRCALRMALPLVIGTTGLSSEQEAALMSASKRIPIFRGDNLRFEAKRFADRIMEVPKDEKLPDLIEILYEGHPAPSGIGKMLQRRIREARGQRIEIDSRHWYPRESRICNWYFPNTELQYELAGPDKVEVNPLCSKVRRDDLALDVLKITKVMATKPAIGELYNLEMIWSDLEVEA